MTINGDPMKKFVESMKKIKLGNFSKNLGKTGLFFKKIGTVIAGWSRNLAAKLRQISNTKACRISVRVIIILLIITVFVQFAFGILIYGFRDKDYSSNSFWKFMYKAADSKVTEMAGKIVPYPVAVVNYDFITYRDYLSEQSYIHHFYAATNQAGIDYKEIDRQIIDQLIENKIIIAESYLYNVHVKKADINETINSIADQNGGQDKVEKILNDLYGLSLNDFRQLVKIQLLRDKINEKVIARVTASHILIRVDQNAAQDQIDAAKAKIDGILTQINGGLDFAEAAKKNSEDVGSADQGGQLQSFARGEMVEEFSNVAFSTKVGEISAPVRTEFGWHIIKVESKSGTVEKTFTDWIAGLKKKSLILKFYEI